VSRGEELRGLQAGSCASGFVKVTHDECRACFANTKAFPSWGKAFVVMAGKR